MIPLYRDPFWGGLSLVPRIKVIFLCFLFLCILNCWCEKTQEDTLKVFILSNVFSMQNKEHKGEIDCETQTNIQYIYIYLSGD